MWLLLSEDVAMQENNLASASMALLINKDIVRRYYDAVHDLFNSYEETMEEFKRVYPLAYQRFSAVHRKRTRIKHCLSAMKIVSDKVYFGTLTFNVSKNENKIATKRKEAFKFLNSVFEYVLLVEEEGSERGRYHVHFLGTFKEGKDFSSFKSGWHSRQNLRLLKDNENVAQYLCKYLTKDLPRVRCNKPLIALEKGYKKGLIMERAHFSTGGTEESVLKVHFMNAFDFVE